MVWYWPLHPLAQKAQHASSSPIDDLFKKLSLASHPSSIIDVNQLSPSELEHIISFFPLLLCGDFNSSPHSTIYSFVLGRRKESSHVLDGGHSGGSDSEGNDSKPVYSSTRILVDSDLYKIAKWARSIGIDAEFWSKDKDDGKDPTEEKGFQGLFKKAIREKRIISKQNQMN